MIDVGNEVRVRKQTIVASFYIATVEQVEGNLIKVRKPGPRTKAHWVDRWSVYGIDDTLRGV